MNLGVSALFLLLFCNENLGCTEVSTFSTTSSEGSSPRNVSRSPSPDSGSLELNVSPIRTIGDTTIYQRELEIVNESSEKDSSEVDPSSEQEKEVDEGILGLPVDILLEIMNYFKVEDLVSFLSAHPLFWNFLGEGKRPAQVLERVKKELGWDIKLSDLALFMEEVLKLNLLSTLNNEDYNKPGQFIQTLILKEEGVPVDIPKILKFVRSCPIALNIQDENGYTPLHYAVWQQLPELLEVALAFSEIVDWHLATFETEPKTVSSLLAEVLSKMESCIEELKQEDDLPAAEEMSELYCTYEKIASSITTIMAENAVRHLIPSVVLP